jgi:hypothetical protein
LHIWHAGVYLDNFVVATEHADSVGEE